MKHKCRWVLMKGCPLKTDGFPSGKCKVKTVYDLCPHYTIKKVGGK
jgi:hypothetical protein